MDETRGNEFFEQQRRAMERMREMSERSQFRSDPHNMPPVPPFVRVPQGNSTNNEGGNPPPVPKPPKHERKGQEKPSSLFGLFGNTGGLGNLNFPFLDKIKSEPDMALLIGLLLILVSEKADRRLLLALVYILL